MVWTSAYEPIEAGDATLHESILATARAMGDHVALVDASSGAAVTYETLAARIERAAAGLAARGLGAGDVLAIWAPNSPEWVIAALGAMAAGAAVTGVSPVGTERELAAQLMDCEASILATVPARLSAASEVAETAGVRDVVALGEVEGEGPAPAVALDPARAVALLPYSSGTTGLPKGVMLTHANLVVAAGQARSTLRTQPRDTLIAIAPFAHVMGFVVTLSCALTSGAAVVTVPHFGFELFVELIERHRATAAHRAAAGNRRPGRAPGGRCARPLLGRARRLRRRAGARGDRACGGRAPARRRRSPRLRAHRDQRDGHRARPRRWPSLPARWGERCPAPSCAWSTPRPEPIWAPASRASCGCAGRRRWPATCIARTPRPR